jgi:hypothetical protein
MFHFPVLTLSAIVFELFCQIFMGNGFFYGCLPRYKHEHAW